MDKCIFTIAGNTMREVTRQTIFYCISGIGVLLIICSFSFTLFAFGDEAHMIKEMGISTITICCLCLASLSASNTISREIEKGTILTLLSKPVDAGYIILGKFFGVLAVITLMFLLMGSLLTGSLCIKDSLEDHVSLSSSITHIGYSTISQLIFSFLQIAIMCTISITGSIYLPMVSNLSCCMFIYVMGNVISFFQCSFLGDKGSFSWILSFFYIFFPNLEGFSIISFGNKCEIVSFSLMLLLTIYAVLYMTLVLLITIELFDNKEYC